MSSCAISTEGKTVKITFSEDNQFFVEDDSGRLFLVKSMEIPATTSMVSYNQVCFSGEIIDVKNKKFISASCVMDLEANTVTEGDECL